MQNTSGFDTEPVLKTVPLLMIPPHIYSVSNIDLWILEVFPSYELCNA
jgi:hypothetical protein